MSLVDQISAIRSLAAQGKTAIEIAAAAGLEIGDVESVLGAGVTMAALSSGGAGSPVIRKFPFAFDTPGLLTGAALYTPTPGDILLDAWAEINTAWNGVTPQADFAEVDTVRGWGLFNYAGFDTGLPLGLADGAADALFGGLPLLRGSITSRLSTLDAVKNATQDLAVSGAALVQTSGNPLDSGQRIVPAKFTTAQPVTVWVSQDGTTKGADPGSTQGAAVLYLVTATPV